MIEIVATAPLNSVQDRGRTGFRSLGIARGGAMDRVAVAAANALLGNDEAAACIEFQLFPVTIRFHAPMIFALTGADASARLDGRDVLPWWTFSAKGGQELVLSTPKVGLRAYLGVAGGIDVPLVLGSRSTQLRENFGGFNGRELQKGDCLRVGSSEGIWLRDPEGYGAMPPTASLQTAACPDAAPEDTVLRVMKAAEYDYLDDESKSALWASPWMVTARSNRMGYQLSGPTLKKKRAIEMRSHALVPGVVQLPPSGQPIIQLADGNSAGGYPKVGFVVEADLWRIAQAASGRRLRFVETSFEESRTAERHIESYLTELRRLAGYCRQTGSR